MKRVQNRRHFTYCLLFAAVAALLPARTLHAAAYTYSTRQRTINAGILLLDDAGSGMNDGGNMGANDSDPYVFYILNQRSDIKPIGWNIVNPLAPATVTSDILLRWNARCANGSNMGNGGAAFLAAPAQGGNAYTLYQRITPKMAPYWEVPLSKTGLDDLLQFDVLLLNLRGHTVRLTTAETEKLRRFVDGGGLLWVEDSGGGSIYATPGAASYGPLFCDVQFNNGGGPGQALLPAATGTPTLLRHPIVDTPYLLKPEDLNSLNRFSTTIVNHAGTAPDPTLLNAVVYNAGGGTVLPIIAAGQLGAGQVVVTATASSAAINNGVVGIDCGFGPNSGPFCGSPYTAVPAADLKLVSNIISWDSAHPTEHKTSHQSSQSRSNLGPAVTPIWNFPIANYSGVTPGAAVNGDYAAVRGVDGILHVFNAEPGTDILGTGLVTPDAGYLDYTRGYAYDEIWNTNGAGFLNGAAPLVLKPSVFPLSAPTFGSTPAGEPLVFVEDVNGVVYAADAISGVPYKIGAGTTGTLPGFTSGGSPFPGIPPAPTFYGGRVYAGQPNGALYVYDFNGGSAKNGAFYQAAPTGEAVTSPPAVGIVREAIFGTQVDDIIAAVSTHLGVYTVMLGARNDFLMPNGGVYQPSPAGVLSGVPAPVDANAPYSIYSLDTSGYPIYAAGPGSTLAPVTGVSYYSNYDVDFTQTAPALSRAQFNVNPANATNPAAISVPALAANGYFYYTANLSGTPSGTDSTLVCAHDTRTLRAPPTACSGASACPTRAKAPWWMPTASATGRWRASSF